MSNYEIKTAELFLNIPTALCNFFALSEYPWELLPRIRDFVSELILHGLDGYTELRPGVLVGKNVSISKTAIIEGAAIIGHGSTLRPGAYLRGDVFIGEKCVVGNSTELKNCILTENVQVPHYNYVGDSILGEHSHMGAGAVCSNLKSDGTNVIIHSQGKKVFDTGLRKVGAVLADYADVGCGCVLSPGALIGRNTSVYPLTHVRGVMPADSIVKSLNNIVLRKKKEEE